MNVEEIHKTAMNKHEEDNYSLIGNLLESIRKAAANGAFILDVHPALHVDTEKYFEHLGFNVEFFSNIDTTRISW